jgi:hypothetical protein
MMSTSELENRPNFCLLELNRASVLQIASTIFVPSVMQGFEAVAPTMS